MSLVIEAEPSSTSAEDREKRAKILKFQSKLILFMLGTPKGQRPDGTAVTEWIGTYAESFSEHVVEDYLFLEAYDDGQTDQALEIAKKILDEHHGTEANSHT